MKSILLTLLLLPSFCLAATNPVKLPAWSDMEKYESKAVKAVPFRDDNYVAFAGLNIGFKNGFGVDATVTKKLSRYLHGGLSLFLGSLKSDSIVRAPTPLETTPISGEYGTILTTPETWFAVVPQLGFSVHTQIVSLIDELWHESAWFGMGKAYIGGRSGWAFSFEPGMNKRFTADGKFGLTLRAKYTFGWLYNSDDSPGTIPFDWFNLTGGIFYVW